jgi:hypothetical protein
LAVPLSIPTAAQALEKPPELLAHDLELRKEKRGGAVAASGTVLADIQRRRSRSPSVNRGTFTSGQFEYRSRSPLYGTEWHSQDRSLDLSYDVFESYGRRSRSPPRDRLSRSSCGYNYNISVEARRLRYLTDKELEMLLPLVPSKPTPLNPLPHLAILPLRYITFHPFPFLPTELRVKIWGATLPPPQTVLLTYDTNIAGSRSSLWFMQNAASHRGTWVLSQSLQRILARQICQESRSVARASGHEFIHLDRDVTERFWFNFQTDMILLHTNARPGMKARDFDFNSPEPEGTLWINTTEQFSVGRQPSSERAGDEDGVWETKGTYRAKDGMLFFNSKMFDDVDEDEVTLVLPPVELPIRGIMDRLKYLAIARHLWSDWHFAEDFGDGVTCPTCRGWGVDSSQQEWTNEVIRMSGAVETIYMVENSDELVGFEGEGRFFSLCFGVSGANLRAAEFRLTKPGYAIETEEFTKEEKQNEALVAFAGKLELLRIKYDMDLEEGQEGEEDKGGKC